VPTEELAEIIMATLNQVVRKVGCPRNPLRLPVVDSFISYLLLWDRK
jgi:hypothetical protein